MKNIYYILTGLIVFAMSSCSNNGSYEKDSGDEIGNISLRSAIEDPFALTYTNIAYVYLQKSAPLNKTESIALGAIGEGGINTFSVNGEQIPAKNGQVNEFISVTYDDDIIWPSDDMFSMTINNKTKALSKIDITLNESNNWNIQEGVNFNWTIDNYSGPTWFGIVENVVQDGQVLPYINYHYQSVEGNGVTITPNMLEEFQNGAKVTVYLGIGNYIKSGEDLFVLGCTTKSHTYTVIK